MKRIVIGVLFLALVLSALAVDKWTLDARIRRLAVKFDQMQRKPQKRIPSDLLEKAQGIILLEQTRAGLILGVQGGSGVAMVRSPKTGDWGPSAFVHANEASLGLQIGGQRSFCVVLLMNTNAERTLLGANWDFGGEASGTARDNTTGVEASFTDNTPDMLVFDERKGLYAGAAIKSASIAPDLEANRMYYGRGVTMEDILIGEKVAPTQAAGELVAALRGRRDILAQLPARTTAPRPRPARRASQKEPQLPASRSTNAAIDELGLLMSELESNHQTNALKHLDNYLSTMVASQHTANAESTLAILERLRTYRTAEAIELLEFQLDGAVDGMAEALSARNAPERPSNILQTLRHVREYRERFPRKPGNAAREERLERAWRLLDEKK